MTCSDTWYSASRSFHNAISYMVGNQARQYCHVTSKIEQNIDGNGEKLDNHNTEGIRVGEGVVGGGRGRDGYPEFFTNETTVSTKILRFF